MLELFSELVAWTITDISLHISLHLSNFKHVKDVYAWLFITIVNNMESRSFQIWKNVLLIQKLIFVNFQSAGRTHKTDKEKETESADTGKGMKLLKGM